MTLSLMLVMLAATSERPKLAVMDFTPQGASPELAAAITSLAAHELERLDVFRVISTDTARTLLGVERQKQLMGSGGTSMDPSQLVDFDLLVTGKVQKVGKTGFALVLTLLDTHTARQLSSQSTKADTEARLMSELAPALVKLLGRVLSERSGSLVVVSSELGAAVKVDDSTVGVTPLPGKLPASAGPHMLQVEKDGFVTWRKEVRLQADETAEQVVSLVPSPDTIEAYENKASRMRVGAWTTTGLAGLSAVSFFVCQTVADRAYEDFRIKRDTLTQLGEGEGGVNRTRAEAAGQKVQLMQTLSYASAGLFGASAAVAGFLWIAGDSPGKYTRYREVKPVPSGPKAMLLPALGGAVLAGQF